MCIYVCMYVCMCECMYSMNECTVCMYVCMYVDVYKSDLSDGHEGLVHVRVQLGGSFEELDAELSGQSLAPLGRHFLLL